MRSCEHQKKVLDDLARAIGHLTKVREMVSEDRDCVDVVIQLAAVKSEVVNISKRMINEHLSVCMVEAIEKNDISKIKDINEAINSLIK
ncbi:MAG: metal-sensing transcriptional repressor [Acholeplasmatales bacterium]|nr:metal-sensing transcriptional repressor [Acholeplasmatales bacterium]